MMPNRWRSAIALVVVAWACERPDPMEPARNEAAALVPYYRDVLDGLQRRYDRIVTRGWALRSPVPGADHENALLKAASKTLGELRAIVGAGSGRAPLGSDIDEITHSGDAAAMEQLYTRKRDTLARGSVSVNERLSDIESWLVSAEATIKLQPPPAERAMLAP
jgi:hypothetical protein